MKRARTDTRGSVFVTALILLAGMSVVIIALAYEVALDLKMTTNLVDGDQALEIAKVGIDNAIYLANDDSDWRTTYTSGVWLSNRAVGNGAFTLSVTDDDGDLSDCPIDTVTASSTAIINGTTRTVSATLAPPAHESMMFLAYTWDNKIKISDGPRIYGDICSGNDVELDGALPDFRGDAHVSKVDKVDPPLDDADTDVIVFSSDPTQPDVDYDWFVSRGSQISPPTGGGKYYIADKVISPTSNPYGFTNANGIYYIAGDKDVRFVRCHITATIVVANGNHVSFDDATVHAPAFPYYPALLCEKQIFYSFDQNLSENESNVDFNGDGDKTDIFTPSVSGIVYAEDRITGLQMTGGTNLVRFKGALISKEIWLIGSGCIFEQDPTLSTDLVNQFHGRGLKLMSGSFKIE